MQSPNRNAENSQSPKNILVRMPNWIGDLVMATPVLTDLRSAFPTASITAMSSTPSCELLKMNPMIDELFCFTRPQNKFLRRQENRNIIAKLETSRFDTALLLTNSFSSAWLSWQARIPKRIGYAAHFRSLFLTHPMRRPVEKIHQVDLYKKLLEPLGIPHSTTAPRIDLSKEESQEARALLARQGVIKGKKIIGIHPGAAYGTAKCWLPDRFHTLSLELAKENFVVFLGDASHSDLIRKICKGLPDHVINLAGATSLRELACLIKECDLLITNDSGPMHLAAALNTPLIALFGSTDDQITGPYSDQKIVINRHVECAPCFKRVCPIDFRCMTAITVPDVLAKAHQLLDQP